MRFHLNTTNSSTLAVLRCKSGPLVYHSTLFRSQRLRAFFSRMLLYQRTSLFMMVFIPPWIGREYGTRNDKLCTAPFDEGEDDRPSILGPYMQATTSELCTHIQLARFLQNIGRGAHQSKPFFSCAILSSQYQRYRWGKPKVVQGTAKRVLQAKAATSGVNTNHSWLLFNRMMQQTVGVAHKHE